MSLWLLSSRTMNGIWFSPDGPVLSRDKLGDIDARDRIRRHCPGGRNGPVAGIDYAGRRDRRSGAGWFCTPVCWIVATLRAPMPP